MRDWAHAFRPIDWANRQGFRGTGASCECGWEDDFGLGFEDYSDAYRQWVDEHLILLLADCEAVIAARVR